MGYILDTHVLLWLIFESDKLSDSARQALSNGIEKMSIITSDENIQKYDVPWVW